MSARDGAFGASGKKVLNAAHNALVFNRRVEVLARHLADFVPAGGTLLDVGCGDGQIARRLVDLRPDLEARGVDIMARPKSHIPVREYDGKTLPFDDKSFDFATIVDVLHHTDDPASVLRETLRVVRQGVIVKDHLREGVLAGPTLRLMDWVGNRGHDVVLPYNYLSNPQWDAVFQTANCRVDDWSEKLDLYPVPADWIFGRGLHFMARLVPKG